MKPHATKIKPLVFLLVCAGLIFCAQPGGLSAQTSRDLEAQALFRRGVTFFRQDKHVAARLDLVNFLNRYPSHELADEAHVFLAKALYRLENYPDARETAEELKRLFRSGEYVAWADYMIAACDYRTGDVEEAGRRLAELAAGAENEAVRSHAARALYTNIRTSLNRPDYLALLEQNGLEPTEVTPEMSASAGDISRVVRPRYSLDVLKIGLLAPLSGDNAEYGRELLKGVQAALTNYTEIDGIPVELLYEDTESDKYVSYQKAVGLVNDGVVAIIGPVYGESTATAAITANLSGIPFLAPTATDKGLAGIGKCVFQLNLTPEIQAVALADFAADSLGYANTAVLASRDQWGETITNGYTRRFTERGGTVLRTEYYEPNVSVFNYNDIMMGLREGAPEAPDIGDSVKVFDPATLFPDTLVVRNLEDVEPERLEIVDTIQSLLITALEEDIVNLASQVVEYRIRTTFLGDSGWTEDLLAGTGAKFLDGAYVVSNVNYINGVLGSAHFSDDIERRQRELTSIYAMKGYDACALLIHCMAGGARTPGTIIDSLEQVRDFAGLSSRITIDPQRHLNTAVDFVQVKDGAFVPFEHVEQQVALPAEPE